MTASRSVATNQRDRCCDKQQRDVQTLMWQLFLHSLLFAFVCFFISFSFCLCWCVFANPTSLLVGVGWFCLSGCFVVVVSVRSFVACWVDLRDFCCLRTYRAAAMKLAEIQTNAQASSAINALLSGKGPGQVGWLVGWLRLRIVRRSSFMNIVISGTVQRDRFFVDEWQPNFIFYGR